MKEGKRETKQKKTIKEEGKKRKTLERTEGKGSKGKSGKPARFNEKKLNGEKEIKGEGWYEKD
jgi:hypothetical protein